ncbi:uncharacterized protein LOC34623393 [Cyclospora cayetanensis]|uniref:Uncharacterized protein LOC34623393 n=2 Tax=Cyclospora cayetanensis TaxID=88456 RepID=A0A6P5WCA4_9EIME|nr:uncharacterized protein LOC34623393 [Cyclospora cayetanensis]OEH74582.1 hypothetical protein cyc_07421 [Cyclospora cayetanensis]
MNSKGACQCDTTTSMFHPIWHVNASLKHHVLRLVWTVVVMVVTLIGISIVSLISDSFYDPDKQRPLPDRLHDQVMHRREVPEWLSVMIDACTFTCVFLSITRHVLMLPFPLNVQVVCRICSLVALGFWMRAIAIVVTTVPSSDVYCIVRRPKNAKEVIVAIVRQAIGHNDECTGMIISGHSLNIMHAVLSWSFYGRCQSAPAKRGSPKGFYCRDVTCTGKPYNTFKGSFLDQCLAFYKTWRRLRKEGCSRPVATAAARSFVPVPPEEVLEVCRDSEQHRSRGPIRKLFSAVSRLPILRYYCYVQALALWVLIPLCYNHYTIDVLLALLFGVLWWFVYHLILTIELVQKKGAGKLTGWGYWGEQGDADICKQAVSSMEPKNGDWKALGSEASQTGAVARVLEAGEDDGLQETASGRHPDAAAVELGSIRKIFDGESGASREEGTQGLGQVDNGAARGAEMRCTYCKKCFYDEFCALNLHWILDFPILQPVSWIIRKIEGI